MKANPKMLPSKRSSSPNKQLPYPGSLIDYLFETILKYFNLITLQRFFPDTDPLQSIGNIFLPAENSVSYLTALKPWDSLIDDFARCTHRETTTFHLSDETLQQEQEGAESWYTWATRNKSNLLYTTDIQQTMFQL